MKGGYGMRMTKCERVADISKRCNYSEDIVNAVLKAERESMIESLKRGERVTLAGRVIVDPIIRRKMAYTNEGKLTSIPYVSATSKPLGSVLDELAESKEFVYDETLEEENENIEAILKANKIQVVQIASLE